MPDILIRGAKMPEICGNCPISTNTRRCTILWREFDPNKRMKDCPLVELPPHGDLVERDAILNAERNKPISKMMMFGGTYVYDESVINDAPVIVPAEKGETQ